MSMSAVVVTLAALLQAQPLAQHQWATLRQELQKHRIPADDFADVDREISSYAVQADPDWFAIAYYWSTGTGLLPDELRIRTFDRKTGVWRYATVRAGDRDGGSVLRIARGPGVIYLDLHINPSAGQLLVLREDLSIKRRIAGWSSLILRDGSVIYENNMVHFAPFHAGSVSWYDPASGRDLLLFPFEADGDLTKNPLDRSIAAIEQVDAHRIWINVVEQNLRWNLDSAAHATLPAGPERRFRVACVVTPPKPRCALNP